MRLKFYILLFTCLATKAQNRDPLTPYECLKLKENVFITETETKIGDWFILLKILKQENRIDLFKFCIPDTNKLNKRCVLGQLGNIDNLFEGKNFYKNVCIDLPITGVSWEQVQVYLDYYPKIIEFKVGSYQLRHKTSKHLRAALPDSNFYVTGIKDEHQFLEEKELFKCPFVNMHYENVDFSKCKNKNVNKHPERFCSRDSVLSIAMFNLNHLYLYDFLGNVAEMSSTKGVAYGGSFLDTYRIGETYRTTYSKPERWLGFRCMVFAE